MLSAFGFTFEPRIAVKGFENRICRRADTVEGAECLFISYG